MVLFYPKHILSTVNKRIKNTYLSFSCSDRCICFRVYFRKNHTKKICLKKLIHSLWLAVFTFVVIFIIGGLDGIFSQMQFRSHQTTIHDFIFGISHPDTHYFAIGTFCSFFLGELHEYFILKKKQKEEDEIK